jgi:hypothetical protein
MKIKIKKLQELPDARHPNNIPVDFEHVFNMPDELFEPPIVGDRFFADRSLFTDWSTSIVTEIINDKTFRTLNSIYQWEIVI